MAPTTFPNHPGERVARFSENPPRLFAISDRLGLPGQDLNSWLRNLAQAGMPGVQLREKDLDDRALYELAKMARRLLPSSTYLLVNGRIDIALAAGADGAHLPVNGPPIARLREKFAERVVIGCSTHNLEEARAAQAGGADFITFGPIFETASKASYGPPPGLGALEGVLESLPTPIPVFALGGLGRGDFSTLARAGATGAAGISMFQPPADLAAVVEEAQNSFPRKSPPEPKRTPGNHRGTRRGTRRGTHRGTRP